MYSQLRQFRFGVLALLGIVLGLSVRGVAAEGQPPVDFAREVLPILSNNCFVCHGPDAKEDVDLRLDSFAGATADLGGHRAIDPNRLEESEMLVRIHSTDDPMPPVESGKVLTVRQRRILSQWILEGGQYAQHWAFVPPRKVQPAGPSRRDGREVVDAFVAAKLQRNGIEFAVEADRRVLARRAALTLTGLPPEPEQLVRFLDDRGSGAYERFVNELLESPRYGEHQARYWLDAVRYGDTHGLHLDNRRGIYPYRDWVVRAFNQNLALDQFITLQLAGDLLPRPTLEQRVATGFVRLNPTTGEGGALPEEFQAKNNFDRTETLGTVLLGMSLTCARCHTHKYDPITQSDYYQLLAFFNSTAEHSMDGNSYTYGPTVKAPRDQDGWRVWSQIAAAQEKLLEVATAEAPSELAGTTAWEGGNQREQLLMVADATGPFSPALREQARTLLERISDAEEGFVTTLVAEDLAERRKTHLLQRGEYNLPLGDPVEPGVPSVMGELPGNAPRNRLGLAQWLTAREHPLVARVLVNRIWQRTFGSGLVRTPEDFGRQGEQPTHPQLLDWLAVEMHESGWDLKHLLRLLVTSRTFRQSSAWRTDIDDPENRLFARGPSYRLDAEVLRDLGLWASGLLDPHMGGEGVKPYQPDGMWFALAHPASNTKRYVRDEGQRLYRRSLYVYWKRTSPHPMMTLFDAPDRESSCVRRSRTNTSLQSLGLLNETQRIEMARVLGERLIRSAADDDSRIDQLFVLLACRQAADSEQRACRKLLGTMRTRFAVSVADAIALLAPGDTARDPELDAVEHASWTQVAATVLASDAAIMMY